MKQYCSKIEKLQDVTICLDEVRRTWLEFILRKSNDLKISLNLNFILAPNEDEVIYHDIVCY